MEIEGETGKLSIGTIVDSVSEVVNIKGSDIEDAPPTGKKTNIDSILGIAKIEGSIMKRRTGTGQVGPNEQIENSRKTLKSIAPKNP